MVAVLIILGFVGFVLMAVCLSLKRIAAPVQLGLDSQLFSEKESLADDHVNEPQGTPESLNAKEQ